MLGCQYNGDGGSGGGGTTGRGYMSHFYFIFLSNDERRLCIYTITYALLYNSSFVTIGGGYFGGGSGG
jgi:hypothetical protein